MEDLPFIGVASSRFIDGANSFDDVPEVPTLHIASWELAFQHSWDGDQHFAIYRLSESVIPIGEPYTRLNKPILQAIRREGGDILATCFAFDFDNPGHRPWAPGGWDAFCEKLVSVAAAWPEAGDFTTCYASRNGARIVYALKSPVPVDVAEGKVRWMIQQFAKNGLEADTACMDWTRLFRLPRVIRDGLKTWEEDYFQQIDQPEARLDAEKIGSLTVEATSQYGQIRKLDIAKPTDDIQSEIWVTGIPGGKLSAYGKLVKRRLTGRECSDCIFEHKQIAATGSRNETITKYVGQAVGCLCGDDTGSTPERIYGLFLPAVRQLEPDAQTRDWTAVLWDVVCRTWEKQDAKIELLKQQEVRKQEQVLDLWDKVVAGMRTWCKNPEVHSEDLAISRKFASTHAIVSVSASFFILEPSGYLSSKPYLPIQVPAAIKRSGMDTVIEVDRITDRGIVTRSLSDILKDHCTIAHDIVLSPSQLEGSVVKEFDSADAIVHVPGFRRRTDLIPTYSEVVDEWLRELFGEEYELGVRWLAWSLAFDEGPIAALSIRGEQGVGKKLLVQGLAECLANPCVADHNDLTSAFQYGLMKSPFLVVNEGFPAILKGQGPYHTFRVLVGGDPVRANTKNQHPVEIRCPYRVLFTANNDNIVETLVGQSSLSPEDRESLAIRLIHLDVGDAASKWLRKQGGFALTKGWIAGDGGQPSEHVLAKHFLWLHKHERRQRGPRLLVEGQASIDIMQKLRTRGGASPLVVETILKMLDDKVPPPGLAVDDNELYVLSSGVLDYFRRKMSPITREVLSQAQIGSSLKGLAQDQDSYPRELKTRKGEGRKRWIRLDIDTLLAAAQTTGAECRKLEALVDARLAMASGVTFEEVRDGRRKKQRGEA